MDLALVMTSKCTAACTHCSTSCGPRRPEALDRAEIFRLMEEAVAIDDGQRTCFHITGGEPFLDFDLLLASVSHAHSLGASVSCVTNAFWARSADLARAKLAPLRHAGLGLLSVSASRFHEQFVPLRNVGFALEAAKALGLETELKGAVTQSDLQPGGVLERWRESLDADLVEIFPILPYLRNGATTLAEHEYVRMHGLPEDACPSEIVSIEPDGVAMSCCGQAPASRFLEIGDVRRDTLETITRRFRTAPRQRILRELGPIAFAERAIEQGLGHLLRDSYGGPCDLCIHIGSTPALRRVADEMCSDEHAGKSTSPTRRTTMSSNQIDEILYMLAKAAVDSDFSRKLQETPEAAAKDCVVVLTDDQRALLEMLKPQLGRFGSDSRRHPDDARNWALGLLVSAIPARSADWTVNLKSIPRRPKHAAKFELVVASVKRDPPSPVHPDHGQGNP